MSTGTIVKKRQYLWAAVMIIISIIISAIIFFVLTWHTPQSLLVKDDPSGPLPDDISKLASYYTDQRYDSRKDEIENKAKVLILDSFSKFNAGSLSRDDLEKELNMLSPFSSLTSLSDNIKKYIDSADMYKTAYNNGMQAYKSGNDELAAKDLSLLSDVGFIGYPEAELALDESKKAIYEKYTILASQQINAYDFESAKKTVDVLLEYFPNDWKVKNLDISCRDVQLYDGDVQHFFFHPLIAYPERAFDKIGDATGQDNYMVTVSEFNKIIKQLYDKGYILIDINSLYEAQFDASGRTVSVKKRPIYVPKGKKPLIISVDDINYYDYMRLDGQVYKLVLDADGNVETYSKDMQGKDNYSKDNEIVPILDTFVMNNPDFSMNGAKGCLAVTGFNGILGYNIYDKNVKDFDAQKAEVEAVVKRLKETGWSFASHSQGHRHSSQITFELFKNDTDRWAKEILPLIGKTSVYVYPFGEAVPTDSDKFEYLKENGFAFFCTISSASRFNWHNDYVIQTRRAIDGIALRDKRLYDIFDVPKIIDPVRPSYQDWLKWAKSKSIIAD